MCRCKRLVLKTRPRTPRSPRTAWRAASPHPALASATLSLAGLLLLAWPLLVAPLVEPRIATMARRGRG